MKKITFYPLILIVFFCFKIQEQTPSENNECVNAIELTLEESFFSLTLEATNSLKTEVDFSDLKPDFTLVKTLSNK
ncbi:hypothetical protein LPB136_00880 [Tenacibaculum todarodis]|uniref:Uncharacterized protein n=2 Tax=Tenacibaculum todarodis TaxID=1850252 RepID=A0A1L3JFX0_9FLAO|nr:hypothetical protein LPB136_00880 [Tenacibaculum todarodis]